MNSATWLPHPWLSSLLALSWLLLQHSLAPVHLLASALIGVVLPSACSNSNCEVCMFMSSVL